MASSDRGKKGAAKAAKPGGAKSGGAKAGGAKAGGAKPGAGLAVRLDGRELPEAEARALWSAFSEAMEASQGDAAAFAAGRGYASATPVFDKGRAVLVIKTALTVIGLVVLGVVAASCVSAAAPENRVENAQEAVREALEMPDPPVTAWHCYPWTEWCFRSLEKCDAARRGLMLTFTSPTAAESAACMPAKEVHCYKYDSPSRGEGAEDCYVTPARCAQAEADVVATHGNETSPCALTR